MTEPSVARPEDIAGMQAALDLAYQAYAQGEVPVGAVVMREGAVIGRGFNQTISAHDASAHAEVQAIRDAGRTMGNYRLSDCTMYVTLEPCAMCAGAIMNARLSRLVYGASEPKTGAAGSIVNLFENPSLNHHTAVQAGILAQACGHLLGRFFAARRRVNQQQAVPLREDALRTPAKAFETLTDFNHPRRSLDAPDILNGLQLEYIDVPPNRSNLAERHALKTWLLVHPLHGWSASWQHWIGPLLARGYRVVVPDLIGFGYSDKPKKAAVHTPDFHGTVVRTLVSTIDATDLRVVLCNDLLGLHLVRALSELSTTMDIWLIDANPDDRTQQAAAIDALPLIDRGHAAALRGVSRWSLPTSSLSSAVILSALQHQLRDLDPQAEASRRAALMAAFDRWSR